MLEEFPIPSLKINVPACMGCILLWKEASLIVSVFFPTPNRSSAAYLQGPQRQPLVLPSIDLPLALG